MPTFLRVGKVWKNNHHFTHVFEAVKGKYQFEAQVPNELFIFGEVI